MTGRVTSMRLGEASISAGRFIMAKRGVEGPVVKSETRAKIDCGGIKEFRDGERRIIDTDEGAVVVANVKGKFYAVNAKCPHFGLPMKRGQIRMSENEYDPPTIVCNFHNSEFRLSDGTCKVWCSKMLGIPGTEVLAEFSGNFGGEQMSRATIYQVSVEDDQVYLLV